MNKENFHSILTYALITLMLTCDALAFETVKVHNFSFSASGLIFPISYTLSSVIAYTYGHEKCKRSVVYMMIAQMFFCLVVSLFSNVGENINYNNLYSHLWKVVFSSTIAVFTSMQVNSIITSWLKKKLPTSEYTISFKYLSIIFLSNIISQFILVVISYSINFSHLLSVEEIEKVIIDTYIYKIFLSSLIIVFFSKFLYKTSLFFDKIDTIDMNVRYAPLPFIKNNFGINNYTKKYGVKKFLKYMMNEDSQIKKIKVTNLSENNNKLIVHFISIDTMHESQSECSEFIKEFKYNTKLDDIIRLNDLYNHFTHELNKPTIDRIDQQQKSITLKRYSDNKTYFIKFSEIKNNLDIILTLPKEQIEWIFRIDHNYQNIESKKIRTETEATMKLRLIIAGKENGEVSF